jgi:ATP-dependent Lhr-like helicase
VQLLERYGVLTREAALAEGAEGGFAGVYPVLKALEDRGQVRRGYFVAGLGAAQFALPGAVDRLRSQRSQAPSLPTGEQGTHRLVGPLLTGCQVLAAADPAQPYGAALPWPDASGSARPSRSAGAHVVLADGELVAYLERGGHSLVTFPAEGEPDWPAALRSLADDGRYRSIEITKADGVPVREAHDVAARLLASGFVDSYRGLIYRPARRNPHAPV